MSDLDPEPLGALAHGPFDLIVSAAEQFADRLSEDCAKCERRIQVGSPFEAFVSRDIRAVVVSQEPGNFSLGETCTLSKHAEIIGKSLTCHLSSTEKAYRQVRLLS